MKLFLVHDPRETEIRNQQVRVILWCSKEEVFRFQISMNDAVVVEIRYRGERGADEIRRVAFVVAPFSTDAVEQLAS